MPVSQAPVALMPEVMLTVGSALGDMTFRESGGIAGSGVWGNGANFGIYIPIYIERPGVVTKMWTLNGTVAAGNIDIGLYDSTYARLVSIGGAGPGTAQTGTSVIQAFDVTDTPVFPGVYFVGIVCSATTARFYLWNLSVAAARLLGITAQNIGSTVLPNPAVPAVIATQNIPVCGVAFRTLVP